MKNSTHYKFVGIDISKKFFDICFASANGCQEQHRIEQNPAGYNQLQEMIGPDAICVMEATSTYHLSLALWLYENNMKVIVENPLRIKKFSQMHLQRNKTDKADARMIWQYAITIISTNIKLWRPQPDNIQEIKQCDTLSQRLNKELTAITNTYEALSNLSVVNAEVRRIIVSTIKQLKESLSCLDIQMKKLIEYNYNDTYKLLTSIPGIGKKTAVMLICQTDNFNNFDDQKKFLSYIGMSPRVNESGDTVRGKSHITKVGNGRLRSLLYMCSWTAKTSNHQCASLYEKMRQKGKAEMVIKVAIAHKLLRQAFGVVKRQQPFSLECA